MFRLSYNVPYFSDDLTENKIYMEEYKKLKSILNLKSDLYFFDPSKYLYCKDKVMEINQFTLADYMDLIDIDIESGFLDRVDKDLINYTEQFDKINDNILSKQLGKVVFKPAMEIDELMKSFKEILLDSSIDKIFISSGSIHAMRYSLVFETFSAKELEVVKEHLVKTDITIIYGPFALLDEDGHNKFIKLLFELEGNVFSLKRDNFNNYRNHFIYTHSKIGEDEYNSIIFETAHREYLTRRNLVEIKSKENDLCNFIFGNILDKEQFDQSTEIAGYVDFISSNFQNIKNYFSFFKSSNRYYRFKELFELNKDLL